ncbi:MAG: acyl-CoA thioesterase II [Acidimicrobiales bacterium]|nr:MAG: acyl-CoA thioesterase II [Acidimicrobiales bacterium]
MALVELDAVLGCLAVEQTGPTTWTAPNIEMDYRRIFGGQLLAQAIALGAATSEGKTVRSLTCLFPREGSLDQPLTFEVEETQTGRAFATRRISAAQNGKTFFVAQLSMHDSSEESPHDHHDAMPDVGSPDDATPDESTMIPWDNRVVGGVDLADRDSAEADFAFWSRISDRDLPDDLTTHQALAAYATDLNVIATLLRPFDGVSVADAHVSLHTAVTGHSLSFHRPVRMDDWCLIAQHGVSLAGARGYGTGTVRTHDGTLAANFTQESMIRPLAPAS